MKNLEKDYKSLHQIPEIGFNEYNDLIADLDDDGIYETIQIHVECDEDNYVSKVSLTSENQKVICGYIQDTYAIKEKTTFEISELVTDAPCGKVIKTKNENYFPLTLKILGFVRVMKRSIEP